MIIPVNRIFLMLGTDCNLQCRYCLQHDMKNTDNPTMVSEEVMEWLRSCIRTQNGRISVTFYGGEPLVYWKAVQQVVEEFHNYMNFGMITNGKLLDEDKVSFINAYKMRVALSWDGRNVAKTRGYDVIRENPCVLGINALCLSAVVSAYTYPKDFLDAAEPVSEQYYQLHGRYPALNIDTIMDFGNCPDLADMDMNRLEQEMTEIVRKEKPIYQRYLDHFYSVDALVSKGEADTAKCGNGVYVWNVDTQGNVYRCHNAAEKLGHIGDSPVKLIAKAASIDPTRQNYAKCRSCSAERFCRGGCPLIGEAARDKYYCDIKRAFYGPVLRDIDKPTEAGKEIILR